MIDCYIINVIMHSIRDKDLANRTKFKRVSRFDISYPI